MKLENILLGFCVVVLLAFLAITAFSAANLIFILFTWLLSFGWIVTAYITGAFIAVIGGLYLLNFIGAKMHAYFDER